MNPTRPVVLIVVAAAALPSLLAFNASPSPTFLNQALACALWGAFVAVAAGGWDQKQFGGLPAALGLLIGAAGWSWAGAALPSPLGLSAVTLLAAAGLLALAGTATCARQQVGREALFTAFAWAWLTAGVLNLLIALIQVFTPSLPDGTWIAASGIPGRAVGNLRQPNHLSSLLLWSCISVVVLLDLRRLSVRWAAALLAAFVFAVVLPASRTGLVSVLLLGLWGLFDRRLSRPARLLLLAAPLVYAAAWWGLAQWAALSSHNFGGTARLAESDISGSRFGIWKNTLALIQAHPWTGVGFGNFNFAWTLTPFPGRPTAFFDHTHNLPLQLAVELGLPLAALVLGLLLWALGRGAWLAWRAEGDAGTTQRGAVMMVLMIGLHSLLEYPLWYAYFLLPTAWAFGYALRGPAADGAAAAHTRVPTLRLAGWALVAGALFSVWDYSRVAAIFVAEPGAAPLAQRIARGQQSVFFGHHADYAAVTSAPPGTVPAQAFDRTTHYLLDTRLMTAWSQALAAQGELDAARHVAARLREFGKAESDGFFDACANEAAVPPAASAPASTAMPQPFQCEAPALTQSWQQFLPAR